VVAVERDAAQSILRRKSLDPVRPHFQARAHFCERLGKTHIALDGIAPDTFDPQRAAADGAQGQEIGRRRGVALDMHAARRPIARAGRHAEALRAHARHLHAETRHAGERDVDVGPRDQLAFDLDRGCDAGQRQGHQETGEKLAGDIAAYLEHASRPQAGRPDVQRRIAGFFQIFDVGAQLGERLDQVADRPLVLARHALHAIFAAGKRQGGGQRPEGGAGIAKKKLGISHRKAAAAAGDAPGAVVLFLDLHAQGLQGFEHARRIVGHEQVAHFGAAFGQGGEQQDAVGDAFRTGQADGAARRDHLGQINEFHAEISRKSATFSAPAFRPRRAAPCGRWQSSVRDARRRHAPGRP
jgi:hypothetical protein